MLVSFCIFWLCPLSNPKGSNIGLTDTVAVVMNDIESQTPVSRRWTQQQTHHPMLPGHQRAAASFSGRLSSTKATIKGSSTLVSGAGFRVQREFLSFSFADISLRSWVRVRPDQTPRPPHAAPSACSEQTKAAEWKQKTKGLVI